MLDFINLVEWIPTVFSYWMGLMLAWSIFLFFDIRKMIHCINRRHAHLRIQDQIHMFGIIGGTTCGVVSTAISIFGTSSFMDFFIGASIWYTIYLSYVSFHVYTAMVRVDPSNVKENHSTIFDFLFR